MQTCMGIYVCMWGNKYTHYTHVFIYTCMYVSMFVCVCIYVISMPAFRYFYMQTNMSRYIGRHVYMQIHTLHTCMHINMCMYAYRHTLM